MKISDYEYQVIEMTRQLQVANNDADTNAFSKRAYQNLEGQVKSLRNENQRLVAEIRSQRAAQRVQENSKPTPRMHIFTKNDLKQFFNTE